MYKIIGKKKLYRIIGTFQIILLCLRYGKRKREKELPNIDTSGESKDLRKGG